MYLVLALLVIGTANVGLALNYASRRADRALRRDQANLDHAYRMIGTGSMTHGSTAPELTADMKQTLAGGI